MWLTISANRDMRPEGLGCPNPGNQALGAQAAARIATALTSAPTPAS
jgi:hypothetical protein